MPHGGMGGDRLLDRGELQIQAQYFKNYSPALGWDMKCQVYGRAGQPVLYIPCQDGRFFDFWHLPLKLVV